MMDRIKRCLQIFLLLLLVTAALASAVSADGITLGSGAVATGNQVYFGTYYEKPVLWRVLKTGDGKALLLSEYLLDSTQFNRNYTVANANVWQDSMAQSWCGGFYSDRFTLAEKSAVIQTSKTDEAYSGRYINFGTSSLNGEYIFFLSAEEAETYFSIDDDDSRKAYFEGETNASFWWLRSPHASNSGNAGEVNPYGEVHNNYVHGDYGARPAFNLNLSSVLFSSEIPQSSNQYELTLKDSSLSISVTNGTVVTRNGSTVSIPYTNSSGTKAYVMVTDKAYTESGASVLYYAELATGGTGTFTIDGSWGTNYKVYLLAVNEGGEKKTDAASTPVEITIPDKSEQTVTAPTAVSPLTYTGSEQSLVTAGTAENGTMKYAVTTENTKPADTAYTYTDRSLPTGTDAKTYYVWYRSIGNEGYNDYDGSSSVSVTIAPADPEKPKDLKATYGDTLADVTIPSGWAWADSSASVGDAGTKTFKANYTSPDTNHNSKQGEDLSVTVGKADNTAKITNTAEVVQGGNTVYLSGNVTDAVGSISYAISGETNGCSLSGSVLTSGENTGSCTVTVTAAGDKNHKEKSADITVNIIEKTTAPNTTPPVAADGWTEDGESHPLLKSVGSSDGGTYQYQVNDGSWTPDTASLKATSAGTYNIYYYIKGTGIYKDNGSESDPLGTLTVIIDKRGRESIRFFPIDQCPELPKTGFSVHHPTVLSNQQKDLHYSVSGMTLIIPSLDVSSEIYSVPLTDHEYDVSRLGSSVGMLEGSSLPGEGMSLITGHNHLNITEAGPFALLIEMEIGDHIFVQDADGNIRIFEVYANEKIAGTDFKGLEAIAVMYENAMTLITCEDERIEGGYANRRIVAAKPL